MLKLGRHTNQSIVVDGPCEIYVSRKVSLAVKAPATTRVLRGELPDAAWIRHQHCIFDQTPPVDDGGKRFDQLMQEGEFDV